jgi:hypothetical protein
MHCNDNKDNEGGKDKDGREGQKQQMNGNEAAEAAVEEAEGAIAFDEEATTTTATVIIVPTKTEDGGSNEQENQSHNQDQGGTTSTSTRPDAFRSYSDTDTRMLTLLGLEPSANPNDGQREDWRQLTGFVGIEEERRRHNDEDGGATPRRTRLSTELHINAFLNMWIRRGELNLDNEPPQREPWRQQEEGHDGNDNE